MSLPDPPDTHEQFITDFARMAHEVTMGGAIGARSFLPGGVSARGWPFSHPRKPPRVRS